MSKKIIFKGVGTALITPFSQGKIDYETLSKLIDRQIDNGIPAIVIGGTTGEVATLSNEERYELYENSKQMIANRCKLIFGTGTNDTKMAMKHTEFASKVGCDGVLLVTPYYNKGTKEGIIQHYKAIADVSDVPILLYNVPSRTGVNLDFDILEELSKCEKIVGIKEASDSQDRLNRLSYFGDRLHLYSGSDSQIYNTLAIGGKGVISVVSNIYPKQTEEICNLFFSGKREESHALQKKMLNIIDSLFLETNPAPVKYAMSKLNLAKSDMRLPMWLPSILTRNKIDRELASIEEFFHTKSADASDKE